MNDEGEYRKYNLWNYARCCGRLYYWRKKRNLLKKSKHVTGLNVFNDEQEWNEAMEQKWKDNLDLFWYFKRIRMKKLLQCSWEFSAVTDWIEPDNLWMRVVQFKDGRIKTI